MISNPTIKNDRALKKRFRCPVNSNHTTTILINSFFYKTKLNPRDVLVFICHFLDMNLHYKVAFQAGVAGSANKCNWSNFIRDIMLEKMHEIVCSGFQLSGHIEIDESLLGRAAKYNKGTREVKQV